MQTGISAVAFLILLGMQVALAEISPLDDTEWQLVEFQSMDDAGSWKTADPSRFTLKLQADGQAFLRLDCNRGMGKWESEAAATDVLSGGFRFTGPLAVTRALCPPPNRGEEIVRQSSHIRSYLLQNNRLYLSLMADGGIYVWKPAGDPALSLKVPAAPGQGGPRNWQVTAVTNGLNLRETPSVSGPVLAVYAAGTLLNNLGCRQSEGRVWCDVQQLGGGPRGYVAAEFLKPAITPDGSAATGADDSALRAGQGDFDARGFVPCAEYRGQPLGQCPFAVARAGGGYATVVITRTNGRERMIYFRMGQPIGTGSSEADPSGEFSATREADLHLIRVGQERYEIPDAIVRGD